jgi:hypothetical protein
MSPLTEAKTAVVPFLIAVALAVLPSPSARAGQLPNYGALDIHALLDTLTADQMEPYNIAQARWAPVDDGVAVDYAYLLGDLDGIATYNPNRSLNTEGLGRIPTSWLLRPAPLALYEERPAAVVGWTDAPCSYLRFSRFYTGMEQQERQAGWPARNLSGHLHILVAPAAGAEALIELIL